MRNKLYNLGDSWAWGYDDDFETPFKTTYADIIAKNFGLKKVNCCKPGWALANATESFIKNVVPHLKENDCVLVTIPPDTRIAVACATGGRNTRTVFSESALWKELVRETGLNPYQFELTLNKDLLLIASICKLKKAKYAFQHNYSSFTYDPTWEMSWITDNYIDINKSMLNILGIPDIVYKGISLQEQLDKKQDGPKRNNELEDNDIRAQGLNQDLDKILDLFYRLMTRSFHPNLTGHRMLGDEFTHRLRQIWDMQPTNGIN